MKIVSMAIKNVFRNRARTATTVFAMAFACAVMIVYASLMEGMVVVMEKNAVGMELGEIQVHAKGYRDDPDLYTKIVGQREIIRRLRQVGFTASSRLYGYGLSAAGKVSAGVTIRGIDMENESSVTIIHNHVADGKWLDTADPKGVVLGSKLRKTLKVDIGDEVIIVSQATDGSVANDLYHVRGVIKQVGEVIDRGGFFMAEEEFRILMGMDKGVHEIAVSRVDKSIPLSLAVATVSEIAGSYETKGWRKIKPVLAKMIDTSSASLFIMLLITYTAVGMVTLNAILMSVFERMGEFGVMKAVGVTPSQIVALVFAEAFVQLFAACVVAIVSGVPLALYFQTTGIDLVAIMGSADMANIGGVAFDPIWRSQVTISSVVTPIVVLSCIAFIAAIYPALKAALIQPVKAIHHI